MTTVSLIMVRFSIRNHRWKAQNVSYHARPLLLEPGAFIRENTVLCSHNILRISVRFSIIIDREAGEIIRLVVSVHPSVCLFVSALTFEQQKEVSKIFACPPHFLPVPGRRTVCNLHPSLKVWYVYFTFTSPTCSATIPSPVSVCLLDKLYIEDWALTFVIWVQNHFLSWVNPEYSKVLITVSVVCGQSSASWTEQQVFWDSLMLTTKGFLK